MSPVDICNQALAHIGDRRISNLDEAAQLADPLAYYCSQFYKLAKDQALSAQRWTFAKKATVLSRRTGIVSFGYNYVHAMPSDCLRLMDLVIGDIIEEGAEPTYGVTKLDNFKIVGRDIWSNEMHLGAYYIASVEDPTEWTPHFVAAVSRLLAHYLAGAVANDPNLAGRQLELYERVALPNAQYYDAVQEHSNENFYDGRKTSATLLARKNTGYAYNGGEDDI